MSAMMRHVRSGRLRTRCAIQRVRRGWDVTAYWSTDQWLAEHLGAVLVYTADRLHGHPEDVPADEWREALRKAGQALLAYCDVDAINRGDEQVIREAQDALHWVADNLPNLWD